MRRLLMVMVMVLAAGCGGGEGDDGSREIGDVWTRDGLVCARYEPHPQTHPGMAFTDCVPEGERSFCWRTDDEVDCREDSVRVGCVRLVSDGLNEAGRQSSGCVPPSDCILDALDNPECCSLPPDEQAVAWDCPTS